MTPTWVASHGLQRPVRVVPQYPDTAAYSPAAAAAAAAPDPALSSISLQSLEALGALLNVLDREGQTLDLSKQVRACRRELGARVGCVGLPTGWFLHPGTG